MRNLLILGVLILVVAAPVRSQEYPKAEAFGGYQYLRLNPGGTSCHGFGGSATGNLNDWLGVVGDLGYCRVTGLPSGQRLVWALQTFTKSATVTEFTVFALLDIRARSRAAASVTLVTSKKKTPSMRP